MIEDIIDLVNQNTISNDPNKEENSLLTPNINDKSKSQVSASDE